MSLYYDVVYVVLLLLASPLMVSRWLHTRRRRKDWSARFGAVKPWDHDERPTLLVHAVSVGEVNAIRGLVDLIHQQSSGGVRIVISVTTDTGISRARGLFEPTHRVVRYPLDLGFCVKRFLNTVKPDLVALAELEVWPNFVNHCRKREIPVCVISGRLSARSFKRYRFISKLVRSTFSSLAGVATQTQEYAQRFKSLGVPENRVTVLDSMKWDVPIIEQEAAGDCIPGAQDLATAMGIDLNQPIIVAGSTGPSEEKMLIDQCPPGAQLILVPRKPERFNEVAALVPSMVRRSQHPDGANPPTTQARIFLLDTMGELAKAYALADVAIVGRSFLGQYGSNPLEPIALGKPTIIGPHHADFADIVGALRSGGGIIVSDRPGDAVAQLLSDQKMAQSLVECGHHVIQAHQGSTGRHAKMLFELLSEKSHDGHGSPVVRPNR